MYDLLLKVILPVSQKLWRILRLGLENNLWTEKEILHHANASRCPFSLLHSGSSQKNRKQDILLKQEPRSSEL